MRELTANTRQARAPHSTLVQCEMAAGGQGVVFSFLGGFC